MSNIERQIQGCRIEDIIEFIDSQSNKYLKQFEWLNQKKRPKFNWAATIMNDIWFSSRLLQRKASCQL